jgi:hypothetical protein
MKSQETCPFRIILQGGEVMCFEPWFVRPIARGPRIVREFCQGDFTACPFYRIQGKAGAAKAATA